MTWYVPGGGWLVNPVHGYEVTLVSRVYVLKRECCVDEVECDADECHCRVRTEKYAGVSPDGITVGAILPGSPAETELVCASGSAYAI